MSGQLIHPGKIVGWATTQQLKDQIAALEVYGKRARVSSSFRLVEPSWCQMDKMMEELLMAR